MNELIGNIVVAALAYGPMPGPLAAEPETNWCSPGLIVMVPDGREAVVSSTEGEICRVIAAGEVYATLLPHYIVEPVYPQLAWGRNVGH